MDLDRDVGHDVARGYKRGTQSKLILNDTRIPPCSGRPEQENEGEREGEGGGGGGGGGGATGARGYT